MKTLLGHFQHFYKNLGIMSHFLYFLDNKDDKLLQAYYFGMLRQKISSMPLPTLFIHFHKEIPAFSTLIGDEQEHIQEMERLLIKAKHFVIGSNESKTEDQLHLKYLKLLQEDRQEEIELILSEIEKLLNDFYIKLSELIKFKKVYE